MVVLFFILVIDSCTKLYCVSLKTFIYCFSNFTALKSNTFFDCDQLCSFDSFFMLQSGCLLLICVFVWGFFFFPSSGVSWKKTVLKACLKESFKNLTLCWPSSSQCVVRKDFPPGLGGSDICHFCSKRVYVMERLSAEGYFFHRECFRCDACNCTLRLGGHTFDSQEGTLHLLDLPLKPVGGVTSKKKFFCFLYS